MAFATASAVPLATMLVLTAALNVLALVCVVRFAGDLPRQRARAEGGAPVRLSSLRSAPYLRVIALIVALGAGAEVLLDYVLKSRAAASLAPGRELMMFFAAFHTGVGLLALLGQTLFAPGALRRLGLAGTVALRPPSVAAASSMGLVDLRLWAASPRPWQPRRPLELRLPVGHTSSSTPRSPTATSAPPSRLVDVAFDKLGALIGGRGDARRRAPPGRPRARARVRRRWLVLVALGLTRPLHRGYVATLEASLRVGKVQLEPEDVVDSTTRLTLSHVAWRPTALPRLRHRRPSAPDPFLRRIGDLRSGDVGRIRRALDDPEARDVALVPHLVRLVARNDVYLDVLRALRGSRRGPRARSSTASSTRGRTPSSGGGYRGC